MPFEGDVAHRWPHLAFACDTPFNWFCLSYFHRSEEPFPICQWVLLPMKSSLTVVERFFVVDELPREIINFSTRCYCSIWFLIGLYRKGLLYFSKAQQGVWLVLQMLSLKHNVIICIVSSKIAWQKQILTARKDMNALAF